MAQKFTPPVEGTADAVHAAARAGLGAIPLVGAAVTELLTALITPAIEKRRNEWMAEVGAALRELERQMGVALESLATNDQFIDVAIAATQIALRTSNKEKREALKNAILNSALPEPSEETLQKLFLSLIDSLTVWHLKLLELFNDPPAYIQEHEVRLGNLSMGAMSHLVEGAFPELKGKRDLYDLIWKDLFSRALVNTDGLHTMMTGSGIVAKRTTEIGRLFLDYVKSPIEEQ